VGVSCSKSTKNDDSSMPEQPVKITVGIWPQETDKSATSVWEKYEEIMKKKYPNITLVLESLSYSFDTFITMAASGTLPTIFQTYFTEPKRLIANNVVADITDYAERYGFIEGQREDILSIATENGRLYGIAIDWSSYGVELVCEAEDGRKGFELALRFLPDIIITDIKMPGIDGLEFMEKCREAGIQSQFIVLSAHEEFSYAKTALKYGASDYLIKPIHNEQLIEAVIKAGKKAIQQNETRSYYKKLESGISMVKEKALIEILLNSRMSPAEINEKLEIFKIKLLENANYVVLIRIQDYHLALEKLSPNGLKSIRETLFAIACKHLNPNNDCHTYIINKEV